MVNYATLIKKMNNINSKYFIGLLREYKEKKYFVENDNIFSLLHILKEIILECDSNNLKNSENNKLLAKKLEDILKNDYVILEDNKKEIRYLKEEIFKKDEKIVKSIAEQIIIKISNKKFFNNLVDNLILLLNDDLNDNGKKIKFLFENIILSLMYLGYPFIFVIKKIESLFSSSFIQENIELSIPNTNFPLEFVPQKMTREEKNDYINNLSFTERISFLKKLFLTKEKVFYFITVINGISLRNNIFSPNEDIVLYNPENRNLYPNCSGYDKFTNGDDIIDYNNNVNVSVRVKAICDKAVPDIAKKKLDNYLNIIKVLTTTNNFGMDNKQTIILDSKKNVCTISHSAYSDENEKRDFERKIIAIKEDLLLNNKRIFNNDICFLLSNKTLINKTYQILLNSIKKYSEGVEAKNTQEAILKFWSSLECLFDNDLKIDDKTTKYDLIKTVVPIHTVLSYKYLSLTQLYNSLLIATLCDYRDKDYCKSNRMVDIPDSILKEVELITTKKSISLKKLALNCNKIQKYCDDNPYIKYNVLYIDKLFKNNNYAYKNFKDKISLCDDDIVYIYRLRNQIIHNANSNSITTSYYLPLLKKTVGNFINSIIEELIKNKTLNINEIIINIYTRDMMLLKKLENQTLLDITFNNK